MLYTWREAFHRLLYSLCPYYAKAIRLDCILWRAASFGLSKWHRNLRRIFLVTVRKRRISKELSVGNKKNEILELEIFLEMMKVPNPFMTMSHIVIITVRRESVGERENKI